MRQNGSDAKISPKPAIWSRSVEPLPGSSFSGTTTKISSAAPTDSAASAKNSARQPNGPSSASAGAVADSPPMPPAARYRPFSSARRD